MLKIERVAAAALAGAIVSAAGAQDAVQWRLEDGGNGHWYQMATSTGESGIDDYRHAAESAGGNLASINTAEESQFVLELNEGSSQSYVLGGIQSRTAEEPFGDWTWMDGSEWSYANWLPGEPNDFGGSEDFLAANPDGRWNDVSAAVTLPRFAIEWSADCNGDGIVDYGQILDGTYADEDGNGVPDCCEGSCAGDLNGDDAVGPPDLGVLLALWGTDGGKIDAADLNGDGTVNAADLGLLIGAWGDCGCR